MINQVILWFSAWVPEGRFSSGRSRINQEDRDINHTPTYAQVITSRMTLCLTGRCHAASRGPVDADWWERNGDVNTEAVKEKLGWLGMFWAKSASSTHPPAGPSLTHLWTLESGRPNRPGGNGGAGEGARPKNTPALAINCWTQAREATMDHLPPASSRPKDSGARSSHTGGCPPIWQQLLMSGN